jgi:hypothetical protein
MDLKLENIMKVNIDAIRASTNDIVNQENSSINPSNNLVDMNVLNEYNDAIRAPINAIVSQEKGFTITPSNKLVDMNMLNKYNDALRGTNLGEAFDTLKEIQEQIENDYEYQLITTDKKDYLLFQRKRP